MLPTAKFGGGSLSYSTKGYRDRAPLIVVKLNLVLQFVVNSNMSTTSSDQPKKRDRTSENFRKRWHTFIKSGFEVHRNYHADVYTLLRRKGQTYEFKSTDSAWPLSPEDIVRRTKVILPADDS